MVPAMDRRFRSNQRMRLSGFGDLEFRPIDPLPGLTAEARPKFVSKSQSIECLQKNRLLHPKSRRAPTVMSPLMPEKQSK